MNRSQKFDNNDEMTDAERKISENAANKFTALLKTDQSDKTKESQDFGERLTDYVPASPVKKKRNNKGK